MKRLRPEDRESPGNGCIKMGTLLHFEKKLKKIQNRFILKHLEVKKVSTHYFGAKGVILAPPRRETTLNLRIYPKKMSRYSKKIFLTARR